MDVERHSFEPVHLFDMIGSRNWQRELSERDLGEKVQDLEEAQF